MSKETRTPKRNGPMGRGNPGEKAKNFKEAISRLFKELKDFKVLIAISLILAIAGAVLSILAPDKLADLTDEISQGLVVNTKNLETITKEVTNSLNEEKLGKVMPQILNLDLSENAIQSIMMAMVFKEQQII